LAAAISRGGIEKERMPSPSSGSWERSIGAATLTACFNPLRAGLRDGVRRVRSAFRDGDYPMIEAVRVGDSYFVCDGHKRVAAARRDRVEFVDADVTRVVVTCPPSTRALP
jgi:hypothetical protein